MNVNFSAIHVNDYLEFAYEIPIWGIKNITSFSDVILNETPTRYFEKEFSFSKDTIKYSNFYPLTLVELQTRIGTCTERDNLIIKFRYTRKGSTTTGTLTVVSVNVLGIYDLSYLQVLEFPSTVFEDLKVTDEYWNKIWMNLLQKLYNKDIVPQYVSRGEGINDDDYITLCKSFCYFYAYVISLSYEKLNKVYDVENLLIEFLRNRDLFVCSDENLDNLQTLANNLLDQIRRRGTIQIFDKQGNFLFPLENPLHGEFLRLICYDVRKDEFLFEYITRNLVGWTINSCSPLFYGLTNHTQINKTPENSQDFNNLAYYVTSGSVSLLNVDGKNCVGLYGANSFLQTKPIKISPDLSYEITWWFKQNDDLNQLSVDLFAFDEYDGSVDFLDIQTGAVRNYFFHGLDMNNVGNWYFVRGIIYTYTQSNLSASDSMLNISTGKNLKMKNNMFKFTVRFKNIYNLPIVTPLLLWDLKIKPIKTSYNNCGFVNSLDMTNVWLKNRNKTLSTNEIKQLSLNKLLPYRTMLNINEVNL